jgi:hypothetical protein
MPRDAAGNYTLPLPDVVAGNTILANTENTTDHDIATELTNSLDRNGRGGMLAPFKIADGTAVAPGLGFLNDPDNGIYRIGADDWGVAAAGVTVLEFKPNLVLVPANSTLNGAVTGNLTTLASSGSISAALSANAGLHVKGDGAFLEFNRSLLFLAYFGIDVDNKLKVGGGSFGTNAYQILHEGNSFKFEADGFHLNAQGRNISGVQTINLSGHVNTSGGSVFAVGGTFSGIINANGGITMPAAATFTNYGQTNVTGLGCGGFTCQTVTCSGLSVFANDMTVHRGVNAGVVIFGNAGNAYIYQDGSKWNVNAVPMNVITGIAINTGRVPIANSFLEVRTTTNQRLVVSTQTGNTCIGVLNDTDSAWTQLACVSPFIPAVDNSVTMGQTGRRWTQIWAVTGTIQTSDAREKRDVRPTPLGLDFINSLTPVAYKRIVERNEVTRVPSGEQVIPEHWDIDGTHHPESTITSYDNLVTPIAGTQDHYGLIAQEVKAAVAAAGAPSFGGYIEVAPTADDPNGSFGLVYTEFIAPLIKAVQELSDKVTLLEGGIVKP